MGRIAPSQADAALPHNPFFSTPEQRCALARQRFFDEGQRPSGLVPESVIQSWTRCVTEGLKPSQQPDFEPVSRSRVSAVLARRHSLLEAARGELDQLDQVLAGTHAKALLCDRQGVVVRATPTDRHEGLLIHLGTRVGVNLGETHMGTTAPGITARTASACTVMGPEHFFAGIVPMYCAAAPIHDTRGALVGVLDLSIEGQRFGFDAHALVSLTATAIENRLLVAQSRELLVLRFQAQPGWMGTPVEGLAGVDGHGRLAWINPCGARLLGLEAARACGQPSGEVLGLELTELLARCGRDAALPWRSPCGLTLWLRVTAPAREGQPAGERALQATPPPAPAAAPLPLADTAGLPPPGSPPRTEAASLADANRQLIEGTLAAHGGNISRAARALGVSRGLLYRRLRSPAEGAPPVVEPDDGDAAARRGPSE
jgi:transcriptional regulator of acetoin/glycerol metabolism